MTKEKQNAKIIGTNTLNQCFEEITTNKKGITLIALIITIIIMLILLGVTVTVSLDGGVFSRAKQAVDQTQTQIDEKQLLTAVLEVMGTDGKVNFEKLDERLPNEFTGSNGIYTSKSGNRFAVDNNGNIKLTQYKTEIEGLAKTVTLIDYKNLEDEASADIKAAVDQGKIIAVLKETINQVETIAVLPNEYKVLTQEGDNTISGGLVITDGTNEFVWIPVTEDFSSSYNYSSSYSEPVELLGNHSTTGYAWDSQDELNYYYGEGYYTYPTTDEEKANANNTFAYKAHYQEMVESVNKYDGFYIGRYETTIDEEGNIGSKEGTTVLTANKTLKEGTNSTSGESYYYRWWGLYASQRNSKVIGNGNYIQTNMVWGQQWDAMLEFLGDDQANSTITGTQSVVLKSGEAIYDNGLKDEMNNIYDLRRNVYEWSAEEMRKLGTKHSWSVAA